MKICPVCGHQSDDLSTFCVDCGTKLNADEPIVEENPVAAEIPQPETQPTAQQGEYTQPNSGEYTAPTAPMQSDYNQQYNPNLYNPNGAYNQPNNGFNPAFGYNNQMPSYFQFKAYADKIKNAWICAIISIFFSLGCVGIVLAIVSLVSLNGAKLPPFPPSSPEEMALLEEANKKAKTAKILSIVTLGIFVGVMVISFFVGFFGAIMG